MVDGGNGFDPLHNHFRLVVLGVLILEPGLDSREALQGSAALRQPDADFLRHFLRVILPCFTDIYIVSIRVLSCDWTLAQVGRLLFLIRDEGFGCDYLLGCGFATGNCCQEANCTE